MRYEANADYEETNSMPLRLSPGQEVTTGPLDQTWPGWIWASDAAGRSGYVPERLLEPLGEGRWAALDEFDPTVLTLRRGDVVESLRQEHGWHWCRNEANGHEGWVAGYLLRPLS